MVEKVRFLYSATTHINNYTYEYIIMYGYDMIDTFFYSITTLPIIAKGILRADDAIKAVEAGCSAILVSNHGARQLDGVPATVSLSSVISLKT